MKRFSFAILFGALLLTNVIAPGQSASVTTGGSFAASPEMSKLINDDINRMIANAAKAIIINTNDAAAYSHRGEARYQKNDWDGVIADFTRVIEISTNDARAYFMRGIAKGYKRDLDGAMADYNKAIELNPKDAYACNSRGWAKMEKKIGMERLRISAKPLN